MDLEEALALITKNKENADESVGWLDQETVVCVSKKDGESEVGRNGPSACSIPLSTLNRMKPFSTVVSLPFLFNRFLNLCLYVLVYTLQFMG